MTPSDIPAFIALVTILFAYVWWRNPKRRARAHNRQMMEKYKDIETTTDWQPFRKMLKKTRYPTSNQTCLVYATGQYRDDFWGNLYWLDGHPSDADLQPDGALKNLSLQRWEFAGGMNVHNREQAILDSEKNHANFDKHITQIKQDLINQGWQEVDSQRTVPDVLDVRKMPLTVVHLGR